MNTSSILDRDAKLTHLTALYEARRDYFRAVYRAEMAWQEHVYATDLFENGLIDEAGLETSYARAEETRHAIRPHEQAVTALCAQARDLGLDLGIDHAIAKAVAVNA